MVQILQPKIKQTAIACSRDPCQIINLEREVEVERLDDRAELLVGALTGDLLGHELAKHGDHGEAAVLKLLELLLTELLGT